MSVSPSDNEDAYFQKRDQELRQQLRDKLSKNAGDIADDDAARLSLAQRIAALGFEGERLKVFDLLPLIHVAWADGSVSRKERAAILDIVKARGIAPGTDAFQTVEALLEERPAQEFTERSLALLKDAVGGARAASIVDLCVQVAGASGGFLNIGTISSEERDMIAAIAEKLGEAAVSQFNREFG